MSSNRGLVELREKAKRMGFNNVRIHREYSYHRHMPLDKPLGWYMTLTDGQDVFLGPSAEDAKRKLEEIAHATT